MAKTKQEQLEYYIRLKQDIIENKTDLLFQHLNEVQLDTLPELKEYLADFDYMNGKIQNTKNNQKKVLGFKKFLYTILDKKFNITLSDYQTQFNALESINVDIQKLNNINYEPTEFLRSFVTKTVIESMTLTRAIDQSSLSNNIQKALYNYVTGQFSRQNAVKNIAKIVSQDNGLSRWARVIAGDSLRVYNGKIQQEIIASSDRINGIYWNGTLIDTSRPICVECVSERKGFIWKTEFPELVEKYKNSSGYDENMPLTVETIVEIGGGHGCRHTITAGYKKPIK